MSETKVVEVNEEQLDESEVMALRREKLSSMREQGFHFPNHFRRDAYASVLLAAYDNKDKETLAEMAISVAVSGRIMLKRVMGKASFIHIQDKTGRIQAYIKGS